MNALEQRTGRRVTLEELGKLVAKHQQERDEDYAPSVVARWMRGDAGPRSREQWRALADAFGVDPGWLTYGTGTMLAPSTQPDPSRDYKATPEDFAADRAEAVERAKRQAAPKSSKRGGRGR